jgi:hypothetical protein
VVIAYLIERPYRRIAFDLPLVEQGAFASVGATHFDLTHTSIDGEKRGFRPSQSLAQLKNSIPKLFTRRSRAAEQHHHAPDRRQGEFHAT